MLIEFRVENHRSLRDEQVLSMEAGRVGEEADPRPRQVAGHSEKLLPVAALYGSNGSGKSNVLSALRFLRDAVYFSQTTWSPHEGVPRDQFAWGPKREEVSLYEVEFFKDSVRYQYGFAASDAEFVEEWLYAWPKGRKQTWFVRDKNVFTFGDHLKGENRLIEDLTRKNSLFLSAAAQYGHPQMTPIHAWFLQIKPINVAASRPKFDGSWSRDFTFVEIFADRAKKLHAKKNLSHQEAQKIFSIAFAPS